MTTLKAVCYKIMVQTNDDNKDFDEKDNIRHMKGLVNDKRCSICGSSTTYKDKNKWGEYEHWRGSPDQPICGRCYNRANWKKRFVPVDVKCDNCSSTETTNSRYGTPQWIKNRDRDGGYLCRSCYIIKRNTGQVFSQERKANIKAGIMRALEKGVIFGKKIHTLNESAFNVMIEESAYWIGFLMADGSIFKEKTGNPPYRTYFSRI